MKLTRLTHFIASIGAVERLHAAGSPVRTQGLLRAARPAVIAALAERMTPLIAVTAHTHAAQQLAAELQAWSDQPVWTFPALESFPYERVRLDRETLAERQAIASALTSASQGIVVTSARALLQPVSVPRRGDEMTVEVGNTFAPERLLGWLSEAGYAAASTVEEAGTYARRGGVIDIYPAGASAPVRLELFGNEIDSMRTFDPATQRSIAPTRNVRLVPVFHVGEDERLELLGELMDVDDGDLTAEARSLWREDLARLEAGARSDEIAGLGPYLIQNPGSLLDCLPAGSVVLDSAEDIRQTLHEIWEQGLEVQRDLEDSHVLPKGLKPGLLNSDVMREQLTAHRLVEFLRGTSAEGGVDLSGLFVPAPAFGGRLRSFAREVAARRDGATIVVSLQAERVEELLAEGEIGAAVSSEPAEPSVPGVTVVPGSIEEGWALPSSRLLLLTDHEVFGQARLRPEARQRRPVREHFFESFSPGDFVVHQEYGIGRFDGVVRMALEGAEREYALVQYAGTDRVYVPTDQLERLTKYVGVGGAAPQLNKLGGGEWQRAKQRAQQMAADIAKELIDVYSKRAARPGHAFEPDTPWQSELESAFPFHETPDQLRAILDVKSDMEAPHPMDRLVCADVGYGKTEVAVRAAFKAIMDGWQVAVLVPTTVLAQQHFETFSERLAPFPVTVEVLSRFRTPAQQRETLRKLAAGEVDILIGTHRILQKDIIFKRLGLLIIDEEQRFGVKHKEQLKKLRETVDVLTLTATPIPRTLHMTLAGVREVSVIETAPEGRLPIKTYLQPFDDRLVKEAIVRELDRDGQVYIVHNKVATIEAFAERVRRLVPEARVIVAHGQMDEALLERAMLSFAHHEGDVLICSTIIENGLDIPNVNTIVVNNAHRLGLTQLYQLRGRVGRSANQAYAYLLYPADARISHDAARRMESVFEAQDLGAGFGIAMKDLEIRGAGNLLGAEQSGHAAAIGFDLYTRLISEAVDRLRGIPVEEPPSVSVDLPLDAFLPEEYVNNDAERLSLYRRLATVTDREALTALEEEMQDRFGPLPEPVRNLLETVELKLLAAEAGVTSVRLNREALSMRAAATAVYDRVALYRKYGTQAHISTNVLRVPRHLLGQNWLTGVAEILRDMAELKRTINRPQPVGA